MASMEARMESLGGRMTQLDSRADRIETRLDRVETRLGAVEQAIAEVNGKLDVLISQVVAKLPSWWQMPLVIGATVMLLGSTLATAQKLHLFGL